MASVILEIIEKLRKSSHDQTAREIQDNFQKMGANASNTFAAEWEKAGPQLRKRLARAMDINANLAQQQRDYVQAMTQRNNAVQKVMRLEGQLADQQRQQIAGTRTLAQLENQISDARRSRISAAKNVIDIERQYAAAKADNVKHSKELRDLELRIAEARLKGQKTIPRRTDDGRLAGSQSIKQARLELNALQKRAAAETEDLRKREAALSDGRKAASAIDTNANTLQKELNEQRREGAGVANDLTKSEKDLISTRTNIKGIDEDLLRRNERITKGYRDRKGALDDLNRAHEEERKSRGGRGGGQGALQTLGNAVTSLPLMPGGEAGGKVFLALVPALADAVGIIGSVAQSMWLLPAAATAAGAGIGTLVIGLDGMDKAIKNMGDPKKFAEALAGMGPAAQQAALEIQTLAQGAFKQLKDATSESLFNGIPEKLRDLANTFMPTLQSMSTGIAHAFNSMFDGLFSKLMSPEMQTTIGNITQNITQAFQSLAPVMGPVADAFLRITQVGAGFLPQLANAAVQAATAFDNFIKSAQQSGQLQRWLGEGLQALQMLGDAAVQLVEAMFKLAPLAQETLPTLLATFKGLNEIMPGITLMLAGLQAPVMALTGDTKDLKAAFGEIPGVIDTVDTVIANLPAVMTRAVNGMIDQLNAFKNGVLNMLGGPVGKFLSFISNGKVDAGSLVPNIPNVANRPWVNMPSVGNSPGPNFGNVPVPDGTIDRNTPGAVPIPGSNQWYVPGSLTPNAIAGTHDIGPATDPNNPLPQAGLPPWSPAPVPGIPGKPESDKNKRDDIFKSLNPNDFAVDPFAGLGIGPPGGPGADGMPAFGGPGAQGVPTGAPMPTGDVPAPGIPGQGQGGPPPPLQFGTGGKPYAKPGYGYTSVNDEELVKKQQELQEDGWALQKAQMDLEVLKRDTTSTQEEILEKEHDVIRERWKLQDDQADYRKTAEGKWNKVGSGSDQIGVGLDSDLGISKGLAGMADNLVRFVGSMLAAPLETALQQTFGPSNGSFGIIGALFGPGGTGGAGADGTPAAGGPGADGSAPGAGYSGDAALLSHVPAGKYSPGRSLGSDLAQGLGDCSSAVSDLVNLLDGQPTGQGQMSTGTEASWLTQRGFMPTNVPMPGTMQVGFNADHTQATLPGGTPFNWGSKEAAAQGGVDPGSGGAWMPGFTQHFYRPVGAGWAPGAANGGLGAGPLGPTGAGGAVPVFVTNMGVGGMPGSASPPSPTPSSTGTPGTPSSTPSGAPGSPSGAPSGAPGTGTGAGQVGPGPGAGGKWVTNVDGSQKAIDANGNVTGGYIPAPMPSGPHGFVGPQGGPPVFSGDGPNGPSGGNFNPNMSIDTSHIGYAQPSIFGTSGNGMRGGLGGPYLGFPDGDHPDPAYPGIGGGAAGLPGGAPGGPFLGGAAGFVGDAGGPAPPGPGSGVSGPNGAPGGPGAGAPAGNNPYASQGEVGYNSSQAGWQPQGQGFSGLGGLPLAALNTAASAIPIPGAGQAAQTAIQGINRTIAYGGQAASIGVQGLMQTFLPSDSPLSDPSKSWFGKLLGGFAGARPATGNSAGSSDKAQKDIGKSENDPQQGGGKGGGNVNNGVHIENFVQAPNRNSAQQVGSDLLYQTAQGGQRP